jgi:hypothetical protein
MQIRPRFQVTWSAKGREIDQTEVSHRLSRGDAPLVAILLDLRVEVLVVESKSESGGYTVQNHVNGR